MTVEELAARIDMRELEEWAVLSRVEREEQEDKARVRRVEAAAQRNRRQ